METDFLILVFCAFAVMYLIHSTILISSVWLVLKGLKPRSARLRENLLRVALLGGVVTVSVQCFLPFHWGSEWSLESRSRPAGASGLEGSLVVGISDRFDKTHIPGYRSKLSYKIN